MGDHAGRARPEDGTGDDDAADEGLDVDMAPHSHESDEDDEPAEPASTTPERASE